MQCNAMLYNTQYKNSTQYYKQAGEVILHYYSHSYKNHGTMEQFHWRIHVDEIGKRKVDLGINSVLYFITIIR